MLALHILQENARSSHYREVREEFVQFSYTGPNGGQYRRTITICIPMFKLLFTLTGWPFGSLVCKMSGMVQGISVSASVFTLVAIAVDR